MSSKHLILMHNLDIFCNSCNYGDGIIDMIIMNRCLCLFVITFIYIIIRRLGLFLLTIRTDKGIKRDVVESLLREWVMMATCLDVEWRRFYMYLFDIGMCVFALYLVAVDIELDYVIVLKLSPLQEYQIFCYLRISTYETFL